MPFDKPTTERLNSAANEIRKICIGSKGYSQYHEFGTHGYKDGVRHWLPSSSAVAHSVVQPGRTQDLSKIVKVLERFRVPFAVKGGGHFTSPGISSTEGIQIHMGRFDKVIFDAKNPDYVQVEAGCLWDRVYLALKPTGRNVVGGSASEGVGVAGWLLGGGYSLKTNRYGLGIDHISAMTLILSNGTEITVTDTEKDKNRRELFNGLKGGGNNFGIVTKFWLRTHLQPSQIYKRDLNFPKSDFEAVKKALGTYATSTFDSKSTVVAAFRRQIQKGKAEDSVDVVLFYDGRLPSDHPFGELLAINPKYGNRRMVQIEEPGHYNSFYEMDEGSLGHLRRPVDAEENDSLGPDRNFEHDNFYGGSDENLARDLDEFYGGGIRYSERPNPAGLEYFPFPTPIRRDMIGPGGGGDLQGEISYAGRFACIMINKYTKNLINAVAAAPEAYASEKDMIEHGGRLVLFDVWPFLPTIFNGSKPAAWPHPARRPCFPLLAVFQWENTPENTRFWLGRINYAFTQLKALAKECTDNTLPVYLNTTLNTTFVEEIYKENFNDLRLLRRKWDPNDIMGWASGFRIPLPDSPDPNGPPFDPDYLSFCG